MQNCQTQGQGICYLRECQAQTKTRLKKRKYKKSKIKNGDCNAEYLIFNILNF